MMALTPKRIVRWNRICCTKDLDVSITAQYTATPIFAHLSQLIWAEAQGPLWLPTPISVFLTGVPCSADPVDRFQAQFISTLLGIRTKEWLKSSPNDHSNCQNGIH
jgi:hypothetical protein